MVEQNLEEKTAVRDYRMRNYLIVIKNSDDTIRIVVRGPKESAENVYATDNVFEKWWDIYEKRYPFPNYDVIIARSQRLRDVKSQLPNLRWNQTKIRRFSTT